MNAVFCHGVLPPDFDWNQKIYNSTKSWKEWLQFVLEAKHDIIMQIPKFPHAHTFLMKYDEWAEIMERQQIDSGTILIGHSAGGGFILKYMALHPKLKVKQILLVAPWIDTGHVNKFGFYADFDMRGVVQQSVDGIDLLVSDNDILEMEKSRDKIVADIPSIRTHVFPGYGHFVLPELPEILPFIKF
ncbi:MAG: alpha/beta hydrolase [Alphaproteobacteria bacterium]|nr:alpha/beta hydrolase [Alphaproteobacteria bacterium]